MLNHDVNADFGECISAPEASGIAEEKKIEWTHKGPRHWIAPHGDWRKYCPFTLKRGHSHTKFRTIESIFADLGKLSDV